MEPVADATADAPESMAIGVRVGVDGFYQQVEAYCQTQQANLADLQAQVLLQSQTQARNLAQQERLPEQLLTELEALIEAQEQQLRLFQSRRDREQQSQKTRQLFTDKKIEALTHSLAQTEERLAELEAQALAARTWAISLNGQRQAAQTNVLELQAQLNQRRSHRQALQAELDERQQSLDQQRRLTESQTTVITALQRDLATAHRTIESLEKQILQGLRQQSGLSQLRQESELRKQRDGQQQQAQSDEHIAYQTTIADQAGLLRQTEAEVQEWRRRSLAYQHQLQNIRDWLERYSSEAADPEAAAQAPALPPALLELILAPTPEPFVAATDQPQPEHTLEQTLDRKPLEKHKKPLHLNKDVLELPRLPQ
ncbi:MAG: hypothetical protein HC771_10710 [Synechococcales cyanobacterium CRU_2_2]|nr:hypothetical protein [Synechococcales cyanobacterium CRU_2_2]